MNNNKNLIPSVNTFSANFYRNNVTVNVNYKSLKRPRSRMINIRQNTEENRSINNLNSNKSAISQVQFNKHALRNLKKIWNKEIGKIKNARIYPKRELSLTRLGK